MDHFYENKHIIIPPTVFLLIRVKLYREQDIYARHKHKHCNVITVMGFFLKWISSFCDLNGIADYFSYKYCTVVKYFFCYAQKLLFVLVAMHSI